MANYENCGEVEVEKVKFGIESEKSDPELHFFEFGISEHRAGFAGKNWSNSYSPCMVSLESYRSADLLLA